jgi:uncharacterized membrane protein YfcA
MLISLVIAPGGSGGAQLYYPLFTVLLGFSVRDTAAVVSFVMFVGAVVSFSMALVEKHPTNEHRTLTDFGSVLVVAPAVLLGVAGGVILNAILPVWLLQAASVAVFLWAFVKIGGNLLAIRAKERERAEAVRVLAADLVEVEKKGGGGKDLERGCGGGNGGSAFAAAAAAATLAEGQDDHDGANPTPLNARDTALAAAAVLASARRSGSLNHLQSALTRRISLDLVKLASLDEEVVALEAAAGLDVSGGSGGCGCEVVVAAAEEDEAAAGKASGAADADATTTVTVVVGKEPAGNDDADAAKNPTSKATPKARSSLIPTTALKTWARRQPATLILLTVAVLAQQLVFSVLQRSVVAACSDAWYGVLGARVAVTIAIAVGAGVVVSRFNARFDREHGGVVAGGAVVVVAADGAGNDDNNPNNLNNNSKLNTPSFSSWRKRRASARAARRAAKQAKLAQNLEAIQWRPKDMVKMNGVMLLIGVLGGCLGLGGGFAIAPLLLSYGLDPRPQAATSKAILLISTLASSASFLIAGRLPLTHALVFGAINVVFTPIGVLATNALIRRTGRPSILVALNALSYGAGVVVLLALSAVPGWIATAKGDVSAGFALGNLCPV